MAEFEMINKMEMAVQLVMEDILPAQPDLCSCQRCRMDIIALTLNTLPPRYVVSFFGDIMTQFDLETFQWKADVMVAVIRAIEVVRKKPRHM